MKKIVSKNPLYFAFLFPALVDGAITLVGQDSAYWTNRVVNEASPAYYFLLASPWLFALGSIFWYVIWYIVFKKLKEPINLFLCFLFISGHSWGSSSWLWTVMKRNGIYVRENQMSVIFAWGLIVVYFALIALFSTYGVKVYFNNKTKK